MIAIVAGLAIASYAQYMFLNPDFGVLDGSAIQWHVYAKQAVINLIIWAGILAVILVVQNKIAKDIFHMGIVMVSVILIAAQGSGMVSLMVNSKPKAKEYLSAKNRYTVSSQDNIIMFYLDNLSNELFDDILEQYPDIAEGMKDFTYYNNANCDSRVTFPAMASWLTGVQYDGTQSVSDFFQNAWQNGQTQAFYAKLKEMGYAINIYADEYTVTDDIRYISTIADNIEKRSESKVDYTQLKKVYKLAAFRNFPLMMKAPMWVSTDDIQGIVQVGTTENAIRSDYHFISTLRESSLSVDEQKKYYTVQYLTGAHSPFRSDENGNYTAEGSDEIRQAAGYLRAVLEYIEQLKMHGVYDRATIIISADHGAWDRLQFAYLIKEPADSFEKMQVTNAPISPQREHFGTVMSILGVDGFGTSIFDFSENQVIERTCTYPKLRSDYPLVNKAGTTVEGNYNVVYVVKYEGNRYTLENEYNSPDDIIPMVDSFW